MLFRKGFRFNSIQLKAGREAGVMHGPAENVLGDKRQEERGSVGVRADLRLFGAKHSPAGSGCDPTTRSRSHQSLSSDLEDTPPQTSDRLRSIGGLAARCLEARQHLDHLFSDRTKGLSFSAI